MRQNGPPNVSNQLSSLKMAQSNQVTSEPLGLSLRSADSSLSFSLSIYISILHWLTKSRIMLRESFNLKI